MTDILWYYVENGQQIGPVSEREIQSLVNTGAIKEQTLVWNESMDDWQEAGHVFRPSTSARPPVPPQVRVSSVPLQPAGDGYVRVQTTFSPPVSGLATASLILGILSWLCGGPLFAVPAVIAGHIARSRIRSTPELVGGSGIALAGLILAYLNIILVTMFLVIIAIAGSSQM